MHGCLKPVDYITSEVRNIQSLVKLEDPFHQFLKLLDNIPGPCLTEIESRSEMCSDQSMEDHINSIFYIAQVSTSRGIPGAVSDPVPILPDPDPYTS